jgi:hypothetical protein
MLLMQNSKKKMIIKNKQNLEKLKLEEIEKGPWLAS